MLNLEVEEVSVVVGCVFFLGERTHTDNRAGVANVKHYIYVI